MATYSQRTSQSIVMETKAAFENGCFLSFYEKAELSSLLLVNGNMLWPSERYDVFVVLSQEEKSRDSR